MIVPTIYSTCLTFVFVCQCDCVLVVCAFVCVFYVWQKMEKLELAVSTLDDNYLTHQQQPECVSVCVWVCKE